MNGYRVKVLIMKKDEYNRILRDLEDVESDICGGTIQEWITESHKDSFKGKIYKFNKPIHEQFNIEIEKDSYKTVWERFPLIKQYQNEIRNLCGDDIVLYRLFRTRGIYLTKDSETSLDYCEQVVQGNIILPGDLNEGIFLIMFMAKIGDQWEEILEDQVEELTDSFYIVEDQKVRDLF